MKEIINIERKRILNSNILIIFFIIIILFSFNSSFHAVRKFDIRDENGIVITWKENLTHAKENSQYRFLDEKHMKYIAKNKDSCNYVDGMNIEELVAVNYDGKKSQELSCKEIEDFYLQRLFNIQERLKDSSKINYTEKEIRYFLKKAKQLQIPISMGYAEGWKTFNKDVSKFIPLLLILISLTLLPLFGIESQTKMKELYQSTRYGKKILNRARIITAFQIGVILYFVGIFFYFIIKMVPFGCEGGKELIQSNSLTFFSIYNITYLQQFLLNIVVGLVAMFFMISFTLCITVISEGVLTGAVGVVFFWILLLIFDQMALYPVNHYFANFMPLKMTDFSDYYVTNEIYRILGKTITKLGFVIFISSIFSVILIIISILVCNKKTIGKLK